MVRSTAVVIQQVSVMAIFYVREARLARLARAHRPTLHPRSCHPLQLIFALVHNGTVSVEAIVGIDVAVVAAILATLRFSGPQFYTPAYMSDLPLVLRSGAVLLVVLYALTPILQTLTQSFCNDAIWAHTITLAAVHIFFHEYHSTNASFRGPGSGGAAGAGGGASTGA